MLAEIHERMINRWHPSRSSRDGVQWSVFGGGGNLHAERRAPAAGRGPARGPTRRANRRHRARAVSGRTEGRRTHRLTLMSYRSECRRQRGWARVKRLRARYDIGVSGRVVTTSRRGLDRGGGLLGHRIERGRSSGDHNSGDEILSAQALAGPLMGVQHPSNAPGVAAKRRLAALRRCPPRTR